MNPVFLFDTTHHALWAEEIARECGFAAQVVPAPAGADAKCDLALEALPEDAAPLGDALREAGVAFRLYAERAGPG
ncbi:MAG TPA: DUF3343 domain-containing protein [Longimicrobiales bacterium]